MLGDLVFGVDDETMEHAVGVLLDAHGLTLGLAESISGGLMGARLTDVAGASGFFRGSIVSYDSDVKFDLLGVPEGPVVSAAAAEAMADRRAGCSARTSAWRSPVSPDRPSRTGNPSARCSSASRSTTTWSRCTCNCPAIAAGSASSP